MDNLGTKGITWNLSDLYSGSECKELQQDLDLALTLAKNFRAEFKPLLNPFEATTFPLVKMINDYQEILKLSSRLGAFASLRFAEQTDDAQRGAFMQKIQVSLTEVHSHLLFFEVDWNHLSDEMIQPILNNDAFKTQRHFLENLRRFAPYTLTEPEEKIMAVKSNTGRSAFSRLFDEVLNNVRFLANIEGEEKLLNESEVLSLLHSPKQSIRKAASVSLGQGLAENSHLLTYIFNMVLSDHRADMKLRNYSHPMEVRNLLNETQQESVMNLMDTVISYYPLAQRYYGIKKGYLKLEQFHDYDRYAPISADQSKVTWSECKKIVIDSYHAFDKRTGEIAEQAFDKRWIDAELRDGKRGGGFCCSTTPALHPYILVNYTGSLRDVMTVAHEVGHAIHQHTAGKHVGILESNAPLTLAETASVFGEMLVFDRLLGECQNESEKTSLVMGKIDDNFATVFRQITMTDFEWQVHNRGMQEGELPESVISDLWMGANKKFYGDSVILTDAYRQGWKYIPHFIHTPFYCYAYAYAQVFVLCLYQKYKQEPTGFADQYLEMLRLGGAKKPEELAQICGINILDKNFWRQGMTLLEELVSSVPKP